MSPSIDAEKVGVVLEQRDRAVELLRMTVRPMSAKEINETSDGIHALLAEIDGSDTDGPAVDDCGAPLPQGSRCGEQCPEPRPRSVSRDCTEIDGGE